MFMGYGGSYAGCAGVAGLHLFVAISPVGVIVIVSVYAVFLRILLAV